MFRMPRNHPEREQERIYCRHDNRVVAHCPRGTVMSDCPLRNECRAYRPELRSEASSP